MKNNQQLNIFIYCIILLNNYYIWMHSKDDINTILDAVDEINSISKKNKKNISSTKNSIPKLNKNLIIPPDVDRLILEAEEYKKKIPLSFTNDDVITKKIPVSSDENILVLKNEFLESTNLEKASIISKNNDIIKLKKTEEKLRSKIVDLEQEKILLSRKYEVNEQSEEHKTPEEYNDYINKIQKTLNFIYEQVSKQKKFFLDLKKHSIKVERDSSVFKENYERLIIENNDIKKRLTIAKEQIVKHEGNKENLLSTLSQLNKILSENNVVRKISPKKPSSEGVDAKTTTNLETVE